MSKTVLLSVVTIALAIAFAAPVHAEDISAKKLKIKDNVKKPDKRQVQVLSKDAGIELIEAGDPGANGASLHVYSATDDLCVVLPAGADWKTNGKLWKYKNKATKNNAQIKDGKLKVKIKSGVTFTLADDGSQGTVNAQVQFGTGTRYCMRCIGNKKDDEKQFQGKDCVAAACDAEPSVCDPTVTTTTTTTPPSSSTSTVPSGGVVLQGALPQTTGRFNFNMTIGVPGADAACNTNFPGTHACLYSELQSAEAAGDLVGLKDTTSSTVTSFWAIDPTRPDVDQCTVTIAWDYQTAHTGQFADRVSLNNGAGTLGSLATDQVCGTGSWVGCCL